MRMCLQIASSVVMSIVYRSCLARPNPDPGPPPTQIRFL